MPGRAPAPVVKGRLGDVPTCPCLGAAGIHIGNGNGNGNGLTGMHFDFISTEARLDGA
ncbi:hypothetical protein [Ralstonia pseudosolanacearum]|uniref:hypothetical protein n=1 Tax=Ralstonia pseudosolanacearum TaxID=1310165 RepID=UPI000B55026B|nr:hypothetical protein [Ralstonia pseudosolanacearum]ARU24401.1 hydroxypyruvate reductase [Ralstonia solanacearum]